MKTVQTGDWRDGLTEQEIRDAEAELEEIDRKLAAKYPPFTPERREELRKLTENSPMFRGLANGMPPPKPGEDPFDIIY